MADLNIGGMHVNRTMLIVSSAVGVAIIGTMYYRRKSGGGGATPDTGSTGTDQGDIDPSTGLPYSDEYSSGYGSYPSAYGVADPNSGQIYYGLGSQAVTFSTNSQWAQAATSYLVNYGSYDSATVTSVIGKVLAGLAVTQTEADIWAAAVGYMGQPPDSYPPLHLVASSGSGTTLKAPGNLHVTSRSKTSVHLAWNAVSGAKKYHVYVNGVMKTSATGTTATVGGLKSNTHYTLNVRGVDINGNIGPASSTSTSTTK